MDLFFATQQDWQPVGQIEAIPDSTSIQNAKISTLDSVRGLAAEITDITTDEKRVGCFGWKAQLGSFFASSADAYSNEMGITNRFFPEKVRTQWKRSFVGLFQAHG